MKLRKLLSAIVAGALCVGAMAISASAAVVNLPAESHFDLNGEHKAGGFFTNGTDNLETGFTIEQLRASKYLVIECDSLIMEDGFGIVIQSDADGWASWNQSDMSLADVAVDGVITVDLSTVKAFDTLANATMAKLFVGWNYFNWGVTSVTLAESLDEIAPAAEEEVVEEEVPEEAAEEEVAEEEVVEEEADEFVEEEAEDEAPVEEEDEYEEIAEEEVPAEEEAAVEEAPADATADESANVTAGDTGAAATATKGSADTGVEGVAIVIGIAVVGAGAVIISKKRK